MMRADRDYLTKGGAPKGKLRDRLVKRGTANRPTAPKAAPARKHQPSRKPPR